MGREMGTLTLHTQVDFSSPVLNHAHSKKSVLWSAIITIVAPFYVPTENWKSLHKMYCISAFCHRCTENILSTFFFCINIMCHTFCLATSKDELIIKIFCKQNHLCYGKNNSHFRITNPQLKSSYFLDMKSFFLKATWQVENSSCSSLIRGK